MVARHFLASLLVTGLLCACSPYRVRVIDTPETRGLRGWQKPYTVNGERYDPLLSHQGFVQDGLASWYGADSHGGPTSSGEAYDMHALTAAHKTLPLGVHVRVRNRTNGREVVVRINDRGPFVKERIIDLSYVAARQLGFAEQGTVPVHIEALGYRDASNAGAYRPPASYDAGGYAVQVAAFTSRESAARLAALLKQRHGSASVQEALVHGSRFFRVRVGSFGSLAEAEDARRDFERGSYPGCFVVALK
jgi:rare lipoprotein A